jgi:DNA-binding transcriptional LysR family regulator
MELRQLKGFIAVATYKNFSEAGRHLHLTQPALSRQVKGLEGELNVSLLTRKGNSLELTPEGQILFDEAQEIVRDLDEIVQRLTMRAHSKPLKIGYTQALAYGLLPQALARFMAERGMVAPELLDVSPARVAALARSGELDVAIVSREVEARVSSFQWTVWRQLDPVAVMSRKHSLAKAKTISPLQIKGLPLHAFSQTEYPDYVPRLRGMFRRQRVRLQFKSQSAKSIAAIFSALEAEAGLAVLAEGPTRMLPSTLIAKPFSPGIGTISIMVGTPFVNPRPSAVQFVQHLLDVASSVSNK